MKPSNVTGGQPSLWTSFNDLLSGLKNSKELAQVKTICVSVTERTKDLYKLSKESFLSNLYVQDPLQLINRAFRKKSPGVSLESFLDKVPNPKDHTEALQLLNVSEQEALDPAILRDHYMNLMTMLQRRLSKNINPITRPWLSTMIGYGQEAYKTLGGEPKENDGKPYTDPD